MHGEERASVAVLVLLPNRWISLRNPDNPEDFNPWPRNRPMARNEAGLLLLYGK
jgi:hypothetical protein